MKKFGIIILIFGLILGISALNMPTTVTVGSEYFGGRHEVHNIGLMDKRHTQLIISGLFVAIGVVLFGFGSVTIPKTQESNSSSKKCPFCAEHIKIEARVCKHCGRDIPNIEATEALKTKETLPKEPEHQEIIQPPEVIVTGPEKTTEISFLKLLFMTSAKRSKFK